MHIIKRNANPIIHQLCISYFRGVRVCMDTHKIFKQKYLKEYEKMSRYDAILRLLLTHYYLSMVHLECERFISSRILNKCLIIPNTKQPVTVLDFFTKEICENSIFSIEKYDRSIMFREH